MKIIDFVKKLFNSEDNVELYVAPKIKHRENRVSVEPDVTKESEYDFGEMQPERVIIKKTSYSIFNSDVNGKKHLVYITTVYNDNKLTTLFTLEEFFIKEYPHEFYKIAIERLVDTGCKHHESRIDFLDNYTVDADVKLAIINEIYNQYSYIPAKATYLDKIKKANDLGCGGYGYKPGRCGA